MRLAHPIFPVLALMAASAALFAGPPEVPATAPSARPSTAPSVAIAEIADLPDGISPGPISYFQTHCARCHGAYGQGYGPGFGQKRTPASMRQIVDDMCKGPGQAPLDGPALDHQIEFHLALAQGKPYGLIVGKIGDRTYLEVTPDTKVIVGDVTAGPFEGHLVQLTGPTEMRVELMSKGANALLK